MFIINAGDPSFMERPCSHSHARARDCTYRSFFSLQLSHVTWSRARGLLPYTSSVLCHALTRLAWIICAYTACSLWYLIPANVFWKSSFQYPSGYGFSLGPVGGTNHQLRATWAPLSAPSSAKLVTSWNQPVGR